MGGTSRKNAKLLAKYFNEYASKTVDFNINCEALYGKDVTKEIIKKCIYFWPVLPRKGLLW